MSGWPETSSVGDGGAEQDGVVNFEVGSPDQLCAVVPADFVVTVLWTDVVGRPEPIAVRDALQHHGNH